MDEAFKTHLANHNELLGAYRAMDWKATRALIATCRESCKPFHLEGLYDLFEERLELFAKAPPPADWDGVFTMETK